MFLFFYRKKERERKRCLLGAQVYIIPSSANQIQREREKNLLTCGDLNGRKVRATHVRILFAHYSPFSRRFSQKTSSSEAVQKSGKKILKMTDRLVWQLTNLAQRANVNEIATSLPLENRSWKIQVALFLDDSLSPRKG